MMVIVIGMDNTGKTTLVEGMRKKMSLVNYNKSPGILPPDIQKDWLVVQATKKSKRVELYERFPLFEEMVYGPVLRQASNFQWGDSYFKLIKDLKPLIIYTRPTLQTVLDFKDREQMDGVIREAKTLLNRFDELAFRLMADKWKVLPYDYDVYPVDWVTYWVQKGGRFDE